MGEARRKQQTVDTELTILRMFYEAWETFHGLPAEEPENKKMAAEHMVEMANAMRRYRAGDPPRIVTLS